MSLAILVPTRGRPENAVRLRDAIDETGSEAYLEFLVDEDDQELRRYQELLSVTVVPPEFRKIGPILNHYAPLRAQQFSHIAFMGDDHLPRTVAWDETLMDCIGRSPGVAYGDDLNQGPALPTAVIISSEIIRTLGYFCPPGCEHLYLDNFWKMLGESVGNLAYCPDVIIEHLHPTLSKAQWDAGYAVNNSGDQFARDMRAYQEFMRIRWPHDFEKLRAIL